jgi:hypothetical protein
LKLLKSFDQLPKSIGSFLAVDRMYCWLRNRANLAISTNSIHLN